MLFHKCLLHEDNNDGLKTTCICGGTEFLPNPKQLPTCYFCDRHAVRHRMFCEIENCTYNIALCTQCSNFIVKTDNYSVASEMCVVEMNKHRAGIHQLGPISYTKIHDLLFIRVLERMENG
jgi:hypothetical protein